jgi:hypothetical protein
MGRVLELVRSWAVSGSISAAGAQGADVGAGANTAPQQYGKPSRRYLVGVGTYGVDVHRVGIVGWSLVTSHAGLQHTRPFAF